MAGSKNKFNRGKITRSKRPANPAQSPINMEAAGESAKDLDEQPIQVERIKFLQRQAANNGIDAKEEKLRDEQANREKYNIGLKDLNPTHTYVSTIIPKNKVVIRLFKKPIFELNGFLKPDLVKQVSEAGGVTYTENRFPYLECGVICNENGMSEMFGEGDYIGSAVTLSLNCKLHKYIYFIDKTDIKPDTFDGYVLMPMHELESVVAMKGQSNYNQVVEELTGITANKTLQVEMQLQKEALDAAKVKEDKEKKEFDMTAAVKVAENGAIYTDGSWQ